jgi:leucyl-tRNA synthetase
MIKFLEENKIGTERINFKLRDWVFSRQRYWGEPIPLVNCEKCGWVAIPEDQLPVELPDVESYEPTENGESPLSLMTDWVNCSCPKCNGPAKRETDTMPQWAGSSWYFLRYCDPHNDKELASREALEYWMPVDWYNGGMEHTTLHLLYSRFWSKFLHDEGVVPCFEPYAKRTSHGMILGENGEKMSKSRGNVVNPDDIVNDYGADTMRLYEMFIGDFEQAAPWNPQSIKGCKRFLERFYNLLDMAEGSGVTPELEKHIHKLIKKVTGDIDTMKFNTAIAAMMAMINTVYEVGKITKDELSILATILCPFAPHVAEEIYSALGNEGLASLAKWPEYDEAKTVDDTVEMPIQVNGKVKTTISISKAASKEEILSLVYADEKVKAAIADKSVIKEIVVPGKIINVVVK